VRSPTLERFTLGPILFLVACGHASPPTAPAPLAGGALTDEQVAAVTLMASASEVEQARLAEARATATTVRRFADHMMADHNASAQKQSELLQRLGLTARENAMTAELALRMRRVIDALRDESGAPFDHAYMQAQIGEHERLLTLIDETLLPNVQQPELRASLSVARSRMVEHLAQARQILAGLAP
jgi:putative membrane protein